MSQTQSNGGSNNVPRSLGSPVRWGVNLHVLLLAAGQPVRAVVCDAKKGQESAALGCKTALAKMEDASALVDTFTGTIAVFILPPPEFDPEPGYPEARVVINNVVEALRAAKPRRVLCLSTIGAPPTG